MINYYNMLPFIIRRYNVGLATTGPGKMKVIRLRLTGNFYIEKGIGLQTYPSSLSLYMNADFLL